MRLLRLAALPLLVCLLARGEAEAAPDEAQRKAAKAKFDKAQLDYKLGRFDEALKGYQSAYELLPLPAFLFNIGQCHRHLEDYEQAVYFYESYLRESDDPPNKEVVEDLITECEAKIEEKRAEEKAAAELSPPPPATAITEAPPEEDEGTDWWIWPAAGVAVAAIATTIVLAATATNDPAIPEGTAGSLDWR